MKPDRYTEIDLLRYLAAMMVVLFHYTFRGYAADGLSVIPFETTEDIAKYGYLGVDLFFIISGFVILMSASGGSAARFIVSRIVRLYPAFWVCCTATFLMLLITHQTTFRADFWDYLLNLSMFAWIFGIPPIDGVYWSLFVELKFYFLITAILIFNSISRIEIILCSWTLLTVALQVFRIPYLGFFLIPEYSGYFIAGAMFFVVKKKGVNFPRLAILIVCFTLSVWNAAQSVSSLESHFQRVFDIRIIGSIIGLFYLFFFLISTNRTARLQSDRWVFLGYLTYPLYLIHQYVGYIILNFLGVRVKPLFALGIALIVVTAFSYGVNRFVERKFASKFKDVLMRAVPKLVSFSVLRKVPGRV
jgi:peptidoglycan/LPS O-acetylase OafA/YrhL